MPVISHTTPTWRSIPIPGKSHFVGNIAVCPVNNVFLIWHTDFLYTWCERRDSNPQSLRRQILSLLCIPFHHSRIISCLCLLYCKRHKMSTLILAYPHGLEPRTSGFGDQRSANWAKDTLLAEVVGFEPTDPFESSVFKTAALSHAQPYFHYLAPRVRIERTTSSLTAKRNYLCAIGELIGGDYWDRTSRARRRRIYSPLHHHWCFISNYWCPGRDSNSQLTASKTAVFTNFTTGALHIETHSSPRHGRHYTRNGLWPGLMCFYMETLRGIEPRLPGWKPSVLTDRR